MPDAPADLDAPADPLDRIRLNADLACRLAGELCGVEIAPDRAGVEWLDGFLTRRHEAGDPAAVGSLADVAGSFLGEALVREHGGRWVERQFGLGVALGDGAVAFPFTKVRKHLEDGPEDSVLSFYTVFPLLAAGAFETAA